MTRGRKKDITIPPTRALALQRDYRARKTQYVVDLETRCKAAEEENVRLRQELAFLRQQGRSPAALSPEVVSLFQLLRQHDLSNLFADPGICAVKRYSGSRLGVVGTFHAGCASCSERTAHIL